MFELTIYLSFYFGICSTTVHSAFKIRFSPWCLWITLWTHTIASVFYKGIWNIIKWTVKIRQYDPLQAMVKLLHTTGMKSWTNLECVIMCKQSGSHLLYGGNVLKHLQLRFHFPFCALLNTSSHILYNYMEQIHLIHWLITQVMRLRSTGVITGQLG